MGICGGKAKKGPPKPAGPYVAKKIEG